MTKLLTINNISTILTSIFLTIFGLIIGYATSQGLNLPITAETLTTITVGIILFLFSYINAKKHNTFFDKDQDTITIPLEDVTDEQISLIKNIINNTEILDVDPALEYEEEVE